MARHELRFLHGFEPRVLAPVDSTMTVLDWLREETRQTGTKEGCAEGDCGACTVVIARLQGEKLRYQAINACILFLPQLDGAQLITVEHLKGADGRLHPVQQAMVEHHGSQCGFCTPGFVMSLFALAKNGEAAPREKICDALAGNLCRCTGYRPIVDAAGDVLAKPLDDQFQRRERETIKALAALRQPEPLAIKHAGRRYVAPVSLDQLAAHLEQNADACLLAGGTDVGLWVTKQHRDLDVLIDVARVPELKRLDEEDGHLKLGAALTYRDIHPLIQERWPDFGELIRRIGGAQIREAGTIGGNIANGSPIGDTMPALIALDAKVVLQRADRQRRLDLEDFYLGYRKTALEPGEFLREVEIPVSRPNRLFRCYKISKRFDQDISAVMAAFSLTLAQDQTVENIRIGFGGMAAMPKRAIETERAMIGKPWTTATLDAGRSALASEFSPISDMRASADYRLTVARNLLTKFHIETTAPKTATRVLELI